MPKPKKCDCKVEFSTDVFKKRYEENSNLDKVRLENMYEFGEEFFKKNEEHKNKKE